MGFWLCDRRGGQRTDTIQRFDPRFWTVDFARPSMASVVTIAPDALRVDATFHDSAGLVGLIWDSVDRWDHPLLSYDTDRDYSRTTLRFRWKSSGVVPLDQVNGPTLTIEGRDAAGASRTWYVRLWNYATGTPQDARIVLPFSGLQGGFLLPGEADPVAVDAIDRMFLSVVPTGYSAAATPLSPPADAWVELSEISCEGERATLTIGDAMLPEHGLSIATGYDDAYNQTPARILRRIRALGYRGTINHYVGMSHFMTLARTGGGRPEAAAGTAPVCAPALRWHRDLARCARDTGYTLILSLSFELLDLYCPPAWRQMAADGSPALTGWVPPSALLSPANPQAVAWLENCARTFAALLVEADLPVRFQLGEPWWWVTADHRICLSDPAAVAALGPLMVPLSDVRGTLSAPQRAMLDKAGEILAAATERIAAAVGTAAGAAGAELLLLVYLPTVLDPAAPEVRRANAPTGWAKPAFDVLQIEDYDWAAAGANALRATAIAEIDARLGYPRAAQHYLAGFVPAAAERGKWRAIADAVREARAGGFAEIFVWALPQVARDGFTWTDLSEEEDAMDAFDDVLFPVAIGRNAVVSPEFSTSIATGLSGVEWRNSEWGDARLHYDVGDGLRSEEDLATLLAFFRARRGPARAFRFADPLDDRSGALGRPVSATDQLLGTGDGTRTRFALVKHYGSGPDAQLRPIGLPRPGSVRVAVGGIATQAFTLSGGAIDLAEPPAAGVSVTAGFEFDVRVRFAADRLDLSRLAAGAGEAGAVLLVEAKDPAR